MYLKPNCPLLSLLSSCTADLVKVKLPEEDQGNRRAMGKERHLQAVNVNNGFTKKESLQEMCLRIVKQPVCRSAFRCKSQAGSSFRLGKKHMKRNFKIVAGNRNGQDLSTFAQHREGAHSPQIQDARGKEWVSGFRKPEGMTLWARALGPQEEALGNLNP